MPGIQNHWLSWIPQLQAPDRSRFTGQTANSLTPGVQIHGFVWNMGSRFMGLPSTFNGGGQLVHFAGMTQDASRNVREGPRRLQQINRHYEMQLFPIFVHVFCFLCFGLWPWLLDCLLTCLLARCGLLVPIGPRCGASIGLHIILHVHAHTHAQATQSGYFAWLEHECGHEHGISNGDQ